MSNRKQKMKRVKIFSTEEVFAAMHFYCGDMINGRNPKRTFFYLDGNRYKVSKRMRCFFLKGTTCLLCKLEGLIFAQERHPSPRRKTSKKKPSFHLNLYGKDILEGETLMTFDHWVPRSKGGRCSSKENMRTMCSPCNQAKAKMIPSSSYKEQFKPL